MYLLLKRYYMGTGADGADDGSDVTNTTAGGVLVNTSFFHWNGGKTQHIEVSEQEIVGKDGVVRRLAAEHDDPMDRVPYWVAFTTYFGYTWLILIGFIRDVIGRKILAMCFKSYQSAADNRKGYAPLLADFEEFFQRRLYMRTHDVFDRPICSAPGPYIDVMLRKFSLMKMEQPLTAVLLSLLII